MNASETTGPSYRFQHLTGFGPYFLTVAADATYRRTAKGSLQAGAGNGYGLKDPFFKNLHAYSINARHQNKADQPVWVIWVLDYF